MYLLVVQFCLKSVKVLLINRLYKNSGQKYGHEQTMMPVLLCNAHKNVIFMIIIYIHGSDSDHSLNMLCF